MEIKISKLTKRFGATVALKSISLIIHDRELFFLLGPSGCGKTTLLRTIAGFYQPDEGDLFFGERNVVSIPPHLRNTGMVFQNYALWPHMTVAENVAYGLDVRGIKGDSQKDQVAEALRTVRMEQYSARTPNQLSGGQQQRIALARALVIKPDVLLLDEPLSNLDAKLRLEMREEIRRIHSETRITTVYVTHDQKEALSLADRMAILKDGVVEQIGNPREIYRSPDNKFVADFIGECNWIEGKIIGRQDDLVRVETKVGQFEAKNLSALALNSNVLLGFRPESVQLEENQAASNSFQARIEKSNYLGEVEEYQLVANHAFRFKAIEQNPLRVRSATLPTWAHVRPHDLLLVSPA
ncbi:MAG: potA 2 [Actinomycetia bacterium]|nr:potA 2 [Actinomycetes bacterium]